ncbi:hypothetical protein HMPREF1139_1067 [Campylobacter sp. FOBRC14]|nr:hypothetical protein HMPREF1139_1067 [Campylobacter sp. FOBRC14]
MGLNLATNLINLKKILKFMEIYRQPARHCVEFNKEANFMALL